MSKIYNTGIIGCGDYLRLEAPALLNSKLVNVTKLFDMDASRAKAGADQFDAKPAASVDEIIDDPDIDMVCLFVPPWARKDLLIRAAAAGKHIATTKPLSPDPAECREMMDTIEGGDVRCAVRYLRTEDAAMETCKQLFDSGEIGKLALVRHDWIHAYPQWNKWAIDPARNGGPFMDAEIHNLNFARYLMGRPATHCTFFSANLAHPDLPCADTESMNVEFEGGGCANLFITWAADLKVDSREGNFREHIDVTYMVTDQGWRVTLGEDKVLASKDGEIREFPFVSLAGTIYDRYAQCITDGTDLPSDIASIREAYEDIAIIRAGAETPGTRITLKRA